MQALEEPLPEEPESDESDWHRAWRERLGPLEVDGRSVILRRAMISIDAIRRVELAGCSLVWLFDAREWSLGYWSDGTMRFATAPRPRRIFSITRPLILDLGGADEAYRLFLASEARENDGQFFVGNWLPPEELLAWISTGKPWGPRKPASIHRAVEKWTPIARFGEEHLKSGETV